MHAWPDLARRLVTAVTGWVGPSGGRVVLPDPPAQRGVHGLEARVGAPVQRAPEQPDEQPAEGLALDQVGARRRRGQLEPMTAVEDPGDDEVAEPLEDLGGSHGGDRRADGEAASAG